MIPNRRHRCLIPAFCLAALFVTYESFVLLNVTSFRISTYLKQSQELVRIKATIGTHYELKDPPINTLLHDTSLPYTAAIIYLIQASRLLDLRLSLTYLFKNTPTPPWPIILFYDDLRLASPTAQNEFILLLHESLGNTADAHNFIHRLEWIMLDFTLPPSIPNDINQVEPVFAHAWPGYHHMCAFFTSQIFDHPRLKDVTYYMRMDTDSFIFTPLCYDPIDIFHQRNRSYGYRSVIPDPAFVTQGIWDLVEDYSKGDETGQISKSLSSNEWKWPAGGDRTKYNETDFPAYYNNFEVVKLEAFRQPDIRKWFKELSSRPERVYKYRWGDAPIRYATVNMFFDIEKDVELYCGMDYYHYSPQKPHCACNTQ